MRGGWGRRTRADAEGGRGGASQDSRRLARDSWASPRCSTRGRGRGRILAPRSTVCLSVDKDNLGTRHSTLVPGPTGLHPAVYDSATHRIYELVPRHTIVVGGSSIVSVACSLQHRISISTLISTQCSPPTRPRGRAHGPRPEVGVHVQRTPAHARRRGA